MFSEKRVNDPDSHIDARNAYKRAVAWGFADVFRQLYPEKVGTRTGMIFGTCLRTTGGGGLTTILAARVLANGAGRRMRIRLRGGGHEHRTRRDVGGV